MCSYSLLSFSFLCTNFPYLISFFCWPFLSSNSLHPLVSPCISIFPHVLISYFLPFYLLSISHLYFPPQRLVSFTAPTICPPLLTPSRAVCQASTLSSALWLMLCRRHPSPQCHHSAFKIQSFSETAVVHHLSSPPCWLWLRGTIGMAYSRPAWILNSLDTWSILTLMWFDRFHWSLGDDSSHSPILGSGGGGRFLLNLAELWHLRLVIYYYLRCWKYRNMNRSRFMSI